MHLWRSLPTAIEKGSSRALQWDKTVVVTDGGHEVRNSRWSAPLRSWQLAFNNAPLDNNNHAAVEDLWRDSDGGTDSFNFYDEKSGNTARVRFDGELQFTNTTMQIYRIDAFSLREVRDVSPEPTIAPAITGTPKVGQTLTAGAGSWSGGATSYERQWTKGGVEIPGATLTTYVPVTGDIGATIGCDVIAIDADGGRTLISTAVVGPVIP